jgi:hypothetical protein
LNAQEEIKLDSVKFKEQMTDEHSLNQSLEQDNLVQHKKAKNHFPVRNVKKKIRQLEDSENLRQYEVEEFIDIIIKSVPVRFNCLKVIGN